MTRSLTLTHRLTQLAAAVLATAAVGLVGLTTAPAASAAGCSTSSGITVVVDFGSLGGDVQTACVADGAGRTAASLFSGAGFDLAYVQNEPGFVCRVDQRPSPSDVACVNTPPQDAYWALWWSDGTSGTWSYSNYGVGTLKVPDGSYVGFAWQSGSKTPPGVPATTHAATPAPSPAPVTPPPPTSGANGGGNGSASGGHAHGGGRGGSGPRGGASVTPTPTASATVTPTAAPTVPVATSSTAPAGKPGKGGKGGKSQTETPAPTPTAVPEPASVASPSAAAEVPVDAQSAAGESQALPAWTVPVVLLALALLAGTTVVLRRRRRLGEPV